MPHPWIRFVSPALMPAKEPCSRCDEPIAERWDAERDLCARCALESDLFERDARHTRPFEDASR